MCKDGNFSPLYYSLILNLYSYYFPITNLSLVSLIRYLIVSYKLYLSIRRNKLSFMANNIKIQKTIRSRYVYLFKNILMHVSKKPDFSGTSRPWMVLIFLAHIEGTLIHLYMKEKIIFGSGNGGSP